MATRSPWASASFGSAPVSWRRRLLLPVEAADAPQHYEPDCDDEQFGKADSADVNMWCHRPQVDAVRRGFVQPLAPHA